MLRLNIFWGNSDIPNIRSRRCGCACASLRATFGTRSFAIASMICIAVYIVGTYVGRFWARCKGYSPLASDGLEVGGSMAKYGDQRQIGTHLVV